MSGEPRPGEDWRPTASRDVLVRRAALLARTRAFFASRDVLEVDTPSLINAAVTDVHIHSARVELEHRPAGYFLHTSPEYAMKRLLAARVGDIFQICHVVRAGERSRLHNPEFTLIEWYRAGWSLEALMSEVEALVRDLLGAPLEERARERLSYQNAFLRALQLDPLTAGLDDLRRLTRTLGYRPEGGATASAAERDGQLELLMGAVVGPQLGRGALTFVHRYPASQAALARLDPEDPRVALRFELYCEGIELANGFQELTSAGEQRARFVRDLAERSHRGLPPIAFDERLLAALEWGLPACAGVALGFDRLVMLATGASHIEEVLPFPTSRA